MAGVVSTASASSSTSAASDTLIALRVQHFLPVSIQRAELRMAELRQLFLAPRLQLHHAHSHAVRHYLERLYLMRCVRNVKIETGGGGAAQTLCMPFTVCAALPYHFSRIVTGTCDGLLTLWNTESCLPLASREANTSITQGYSFVCAGGTDYSGGYGAVRALTAHPTRSIFFSSTMFDKGGIRGWSIREEGTGAEDDDDVILPMALLQDTSPNEEGVPVSRMGMVRSIAVDPTGSLVASAGDDATVRLWDIRQSLEHGGGAHQRKTSSDTCVERPLVCLRPVYTQHGYERVGKISSVQFHPDGALLSTADAGGRVVTWDLRNGKPCWVAGGGTGLVRGGHFAGATCLAWSPCGVRIASGGADAVLQLWDSRQLFKAYASSASSAPNPEGSRGSQSHSTPHTLVGHEDVLTSVSFQCCPTDFFKNNDGGVGVLGRRLPLGLVTTSLDGSIRLWDMNTAVCVKTLKTYTPVRSHCWLNGGEQDGSLVTVSHGKTWNLWGCGAEAGGLQQGEEDVGVTHTSSTQVRNVHLIQASREGETGKEEDGDDEDEDEEDADVLMQKMASGHIAPANGKEEEEEDEEEDEMELLRRRD